MNPPAPGAAETDSALSAAPDQPRQRWKTLLRRAGKALALLAFLLAAAAMLAMLPLPLRRAG